MNRGLLVSVENMLKALLFVYLIINIHDRTAGIAKNCLDTLGDQRFTNHLCATHLHGLHPTIYKFLLIIAKINKFLCSQLRYSTK